MASETAHVHSLEMTSFWVEVGEESEIRRSNPLIPDYYSLNDK